MDRLFFDGQLVIMLCGDFSLTTGEMQGSEDEQGAGLDFWCPRMFSGKIGHDSPQFVGGSIFHLKNIKTDKNWLIG